MTPYEVYASTSTLVKNFLHKPHGHPTALKITWPKHGSVGRCQVADTVDGRNPAPVDR